MISYSIFLSTSFGLVRQLVVMYSFLHTSGVTITCNPIENNLY
jgi:hypothetical protein